MKTVTRTKWPVTAIISSLALAVSLGAGAAFAAPKAQNGTTLAAYKTIDICQVDEGTWLYRGVITAWNEGAVATFGLAIRDCIQFKAFDDVGSPQDVPLLCQNVSVTEIPAGAPTATAFPYSIEGQSLEGGYIRNSAQLTILNHSGSIGTPKGPNPKATYDGTMPPPLCDEGGDECVDACTLTQGYWKNHPGDWPSITESPTLYGYACTANCGGNPNDDVWSNVPLAQWIEVYNYAASLSQGYYQLAHQYVAAVLNQATMGESCVPQGVLDTLELAKTWLGTNQPSACTAASSCGLQKDWAKVLDEFNNGLYPAGPPHCE